MIVKGLGIADIICGLVLFLSHAIPGKIVYLCAIYLILKGAFFAFGKNFFSILDLAAGVYMIYLMNHAGFSWLSIILGLYLIIKGGISIL